jgi:hypothetical protein
MQRQTSVRVASLGGEMWTRYVTNMKQGCQSLGESGVYVYTLRGPVRKEVKCRKSTYTSLRNVRYGWRAVAFRTSIPASATVLQRQNKDTGLRRATFVPCCQDSWQCWPDTDCLLLASFNCTVTIPMFYRTIYLECLNLTKTNIVQGSWQTTRVNSEQSILRAALPLY